MQIGMNIKLEKISVEDIYEINRIQTLAFKDSYEKYKFCPAFEATNEQMISYLEKAKAYKILLNEMIIGSVFIYRISDNHFELDTISIHPQFQNMGIGGKVIALIENLYSSAQTWTLSTPETDYRNRHLYEKLGYQQVGTESVNEHLNLIRYKKEVSTP